MTDNRPEPRTEAGRRMLRRRSYWSGNDDIRAAILAIEAEASAAPQEGAAPRAEGLQVRSWTFDEEHTHNESTEAATEGRETVARWIIAHGYTPGHGDTTADLLSELESQLGAAPRAEGHEHEWERLFREGVAVAARCKECHITPLDWLGEQSIVAAPRAEGLDTVTIPRAEYEALMRYDEGRAAEYARLSRPSDERVPESEEPRFGSPGGKGRWLAGGE